MSKSDPSEMSRINLLDSPDTIAKKIKRCKTDPIRGLFFSDDRPECTNLLTLYALLSNQSTEAVAAECQEMGWGQFKPLLTETAIAALKPIQEKYKEIIEERDYLETILHEGREKAEISANDVLGRVKKALGYSQPL